MQEMNMHIKTKIYIGIIESIPLLTALESTEAITVDDPSFSKGVIRSSTPTTEGIINFKILFSVNFSFLIPLPFGLST